MQVLHWMRISSTGRRKHRGAGWTMRSSNNRGEFLSWHYWTHNNKLSQQSMGFRMANSIVFILTSASALDVSCLSRFKAVWCLMHLRETITTPLWHPTSTQIVLWCWWCWATRQRLNSDLSCGSRCLNSRVGLTSLRGWKITHSGGGLRLMPLHWHYEWWVFMLVDAQSTINAMCRDIHININTIAKQPAIHALAIYAVCKVCETRRVINKGFTIWKKLLFI